MADNLADDEVQKALAVARQPSNLVTEADVYEPSLGESLASIPQSLYEIATGLPSAVSRYASSVPERFSAATERASQMSPSEIAQSLGASAKSMFVDPAVQMFTAPGRAYQGQIPQEQMLPEALNFAGMATLGGIPASYAERAPGVMLGTSGSRMVPEAVAVELAKRELSPVGFYSHGAEAALALPQATGSVDQMIAMLRKQSGVTEAELRNAGLLTEDGRVNPDWLAKGKIGREDIASHLRSSMPQVEETVLGVAPKAIPYPEEYQKVEQAIIDKYKPEMEKHHNIYLDRSNEQHVRNAAQRNVEDLRDQMWAEIDQTLPYREEHLAKAKPEALPTKYGSYALPGGENYREVLLRLPDKTTTHYLAQNEYGASGGPFNTREEALEFAGVEGRVLPQVKGEGYNKNIFKSSHWDDPNVLAHIRMADRTGPNGEKILHVEEVQSDWGQKGKKQGFAPEGWQDRLKQLENETAELSISKDPEDRAKYWRLLEEREKFSDALPHAPYVTSTSGWTDLALKRVLKEAAEGGYDKIVWTPGAEQAKRYDLSSHISELHLEDGPRGERMLRAYSPSGDHVINRHIIDAEKELPDIIGKEAAEKLLSQEPSPARGNQGPTRSLVGANLSVGGEGMKDYYDNILPKRLQEVAKRHDKSAKINQSLIKTHGDEWPFPARIAHDGESYWVAGKDPRVNDSGEKNLSPKFKSYEEADRHRNLLYQGFNQPVNSLDITPQMRESILRGQGAFMEGGRVGYASKGKVKEGDTVRSALDIARQMEDPASRIESGIRGLSSNLAGLDIEANVPEFHTGLPSRPRVGGAGLMPNKPANNPDLFDFSRLQEVPKVQQFDLPRYQPARGVPARVTEMMANQNVKDAVLNTILEGVKKGGERWYNADPLRDKFVEKLGAEAGDAAFRKYMDLIAATSPRSDVGTNVRNASYYYQRAMSGQPMPEVGEKNPQPYGHMAQKLHQMNARRVAGEGWDPLQNPKPASFVENLVGNQAPVTVDTHAYRLPAILARDPRFLEISFKPEKDVPPMNIQKMVESGKIPFEEAVNRPAYWQSQPKENEYGAMEQYYKSLGRELGLTPAQTQAAAWVGGGKITGLQSDESKPFLQFFQDRIFKTAAETGMEPKDVLDKFIKGEATLRADGGRTMGNNAVGNALRMARDHFDYGGDVRGGDSPFMSRSDYGLREAPTPSFRQAEDRSMREYNRAVESGWSPTGGGSDRSQSPLENQLTGRAQGFEGAPPVNMPSNIGELLGFNRARQMQMQQQQQQQQAEQEAESQRIRDALSMASVGQTQFGDASALTSGFPSVAKQPVYWGGEPQGPSAATIDRAMGLSQMPNVMGLPAGTTLSRTELPTQAEYYGAPQESYEQAFARSNFSSPQINAQFASAGSPYAVTPSAPQTMFAGTQPAFPHTPTPQQVAQVASAPDVRASIAQPSRPVTPMPQNVPQQVAQNVPFPPTVVRDPIAAAVAAASAPAFTATSAPVEVAQATDPLLQNPDALVLSGRKAAQTVPMPLARPSDLTQPNPIAAIIDSIKSDMALKEGERINALEAAGKTATFPTYSSAQDPLGAQREYMRAINLDPDNPADVAKVKARIIQQDGKDVVDYYTKTLGEALFGTPSEEQKIAAAVGAAREGGGGDRATQQAVTPPVAEAAKPPFMTELSEGNLALPHVDGLTAQQWANANTGGDLSKVHARIVYRNGAPRLEYYTV